MVLTLITPVDCGCDANEHTPSQTPKGIYTYSDRVIYAQYFDLKSVLDIHTYWSILFGHILFCFVFCFSHFAAQSKTKWYLRFNYGCIIHHKSWANKFTCSSNNGRHCIYLLYWATFPSNIKSSTYFISEHDGTIKRARARAAFSAYNHSQRKNSSQLHNSCSFQIESIQQTEIGSAISMRIKAKHDHSSIPCATIFNFTIVYKPIKSKHSHSSIKMILPNIFEAETFSVVQKSILIAVLVR